MQYFKKLIRLFYKDHFEKPTATSLPISFALPMARLIIKPIKHITKQGQPANKASKQAKKN